MENIFDPVYRKEYHDGYIFGCNPFLNGNMDICSEAFSSGFYSGRYNYESKNGPVSDGIPKRILTNDILEDFMLSGLLGMSIDLEDYTDFQVRVIGKWYMSGVEKYDGDEFVYLMAFLEKMGIEASQDGY